MREHIRPVSTIVGVSPAVRVFDSIKVIFPGMSISKRCICRIGSMSEITQQQSKHILKTMHELFTSQNSIQLQN